LRVEAVIPDTSPEWTAKAANRFWVPLRTYSLSRRAGAAGLRQGVGPGRLARGDRGLLVDRDDDRVLGRIDVEAAHLGGLSIELRAHLAHHPLLGEVRAQVGLGEDHLRARGRHADPLGELSQRPALAAQPVVWA